MFHSCLEHHDYKLGRQFTIVEQNAAGTEGKAAENLSVLFLDRNPGPWYHAALDWCQDGDLKNSSGFCGPGSALFTGNVTWASKDKHQKEGSRGFCDQALQLAAVSRRMTSWTSCCFWGKGCDPANSYLASGKIRGTSTSVMVKPSNRHRYWMSSWSVMCQTAMLTSILPPLTA